MAYKIYLNASEICLDQFEMWVNVFIVCHFICERCRYFGIRALLKHHRLQEIVEMVFQNYIMPDLIILDERKMWECTCASTKAGRKASPMHTNMLELIGMPENWCECVCFAIIIIITLYYLRAYLYLWAIQMRLSNALLFNLSMNEWMILQCKPNGFIPSSWLISMFDFHFEWSVFFVANFFFTFLSFCARVCVCLPIFACSIRINDANLCDLYGKYDHSIAWEREK